MVESASDIRMIRGLDMNANTMAAIGLLIISGCLICLAAYLDIGILGLLVATSVFTLVLSLVFFSRSIKRRSSMI